MQVDVAEPGCRLQASFVDDEELNLHQGEITHLRLCLSSIGVESIDEVWLVVGSDNLWLDEGNGEVSGEVSYIAFPSLCAEFHLR